MRIRQIVDALAAGMKIDDAGLLDLVELDAPDDLSYLLAAADRVRQHTVGDAVHFRGLIEFSNYCLADCLYCGLRHSNARVERFRLTLEETEAAIANAAALGYGTVVLQSGEDQWYDGDRVSRLIRHAKSQGLAVTLSLGERNPAELAQWRRAGADRYLLRHETANPTLHNLLRPGRTLAGRVEILMRLRELGYQVGAGFMADLPGQTGADLVADLRFVAALQADMVGIGPFIPHPDTPLAGVRGGGIELTLRLVALTRLLLPEALIPATTALGSLDPIGREKALRAGANVVMPSLTPTAVRPLYQLYPGKICLDETADHCRGCLERRIQGLGRLVATGPGHSPRWERSNEDARIRNQFHR